MQILSVVAGTTNVIVQVFIEDTRLDNGGGLTGLVYNTASLTCYYIVAGDATATQIALVDTTVGTHTDGGFKAIDGTNMPGWYELQIPDDCVASGFGRTAIILKGAANMAVTNIVISEASAGASAATIADAVWDEAIAGHLGAGSAGEALAAGVGPTAGDIADAVWDELSVDHQVVGSFSRLVKRQPFCRYPT